MALNCTLFVYKSLNKILKNTFCFNFFEVSEKIENGANGIIRGPRKDYSKKPEVEKSRDTAPLIHIVKD
jgi:hypothetical protein